MSLWLHLFAVGRSGRIGDTAVFAGRLNEVMIGLVLVVGSSMSAETLGAQQNLDLLRLQARQETQRAYELYQQAAHREAVQAYVEAIAAWNALLAQSPEDGPAKRQLAICEHNLRYCLLKPSEVAAEQGKVEAEQGNAEESYARYMEAAAYCQWAATVRDEAVLETNRVAYANKAGLTLVRHADRLAVDEKFEEAVGYYDRAAQHFRSWSEQFPEVTAFDRNLDYVELKRLQLRFKVRTTRDVSLHDWTLSRFDGESIELVDEERLTIVVLWVYGVESSRTRLQSIRTWVDSVEAPIRVIGVCMDRAPGWGQGHEEQAQAWAEEQGLKEVVWADSKWLDRFGIPAALPNVWLVRSDGTLESDPALSTMTLEQLVQHLLVEIE